MQEKSMKVYYGVDRLPYKDEQRQVHYPCAGSLITGENNTTKVYFYVGLIGGVNRQWVANIKKPDGTLAYQLLTNGQSVDNDYRVMLDIASLYADQVGEVKIGVQGYDNSANIVYNEETENYEISGNPTIVATGTISIMVNYAPNVFPKGETLTPTELQLLISAIGSKVDKESTILTFDTLPTATDFVEGQIVFERTTEKFYENRNGSWVLTDQTQYDSLLKIVNSIYVAENRFNLPTFEDGQLVFFKDSETLEKWLADDNDFVIIQNVPEMVDDIIELKEEIQHIKDKSDVVDIVANLTELQAYDKSSLGDRDIIKVMSDSSHDNKKAYYRYSKANNDFTFVSIDPSISTDDVEAIVEDKFNVVYANEKEVDGVYVPDLTSQQIYAIYLSIQGNQVVRVMTYSDTTRYYEVIGASNMATTLVSYGYIVEYFNFGGEVNIRVHKGGTGAVESVNGQTGVVVLTAQDIALENEEITIEDKLGEVDNTTDDLQDQISNLQSRGRYLSNWNTTTGLPTTEPSTELPYNYRAGDYYIIGTVGTTNYKPTGSQYTGVASTSLETISVEVGDEYIYDGSQWVFQKTAPIDLDNYVDKTSEQTIYGSKAFSGGILIEDIDHMSGTKVFKFYLDHIEFFKDFRPNADNTYNIGSANRKVKDLYLGGTSYLPKVSSANGNAYLEFLDSGIINNRGSIYPFNNNSLQLGYAQRNYNKVFTKYICYGTTELETEKLQLKGSIQTSAEATYSGSLTSNNEYQFTTPLTSLNITSLVVASGDTMPRWEINFTAGANLVVSLPNTISWKYGTPTFETGEEYTIYIKGNYAYLI